MQPECRIARPRVLGEDPVGTLSVMNNLALVYKRLERCDEAEALYVKPLASRRKLLGNEHPQTLTTMNNLVTLYARQGRHDEAESLQCDTLALLQRNHQRRHPSPSKRVPGPANQRQRGEAQTLPDDQTGHGTTCTWLGAR
jgi:hypothetical protein